MKCSLGKNDMLDVIVFTQYPLSYAPTRIQEEARKLKLKIKVIGYDTLTFKTKLPLSKRVILREPNSKNNIYELRDHILKFYVSTNSKILNKESYLTWSVLDKKLQHTEFKKAHIPHIKPLKLGNAKYPYIVKAKLGSHGSQVFKIEKKRDLDLVLKKFDEEDLLIQEFQTSGFDLRVIVFKGSILGIMKRTPRKGEFLSNFSQGGSVIKFKIKKSKLKIIKQIGIKTAQHFKLEYVGVDIMLGNDNKWKVLEVNRACQFKGFEKALRINVAQRLAI